MENSTGMTQLLQIFQNLSGSFSRAPEVDFHCSCCYIKLYTWHCFDLIEQPPTRTAAFFHVTPGSLITEFKSRIKIKIIYYSTM